MLNKKQMQIFIGSMLGMGALLKTSPVVLVDLKKDNQCAITLAKTKNNT